MIPRPFRNATLPLMCAEDIANDVRDCKTTAGAPERSPYTHRYILLTFFNCFIDALSSETVR